MVVNGGSDEDGFGITELERKRQPRESLEELQEKDPSESPQTSSAPISENDSASETEVIRSPPTVGPANDTDQWTHHESDNRK